MKTLPQIKSKIKEDIEDPIELIMVELCNGTHPLSDFVVECFKDEYKDQVVPLSKENIIAKMQDYISFAFEKAYGQRGISANRSIWKYSKWLWALDDNELGDLEYTDYGIGILNKIVEKYNLIINQKSE